MLVKNYFISLSRKPVIPTQLKLIIFLADILCKAMLLLCLLIKAVRVICGPTGKGPRLLHMANEKRAITFVRRLGGFIQHPQNVLVVFFSGFDGI